MPTNLTISSFDYDSIPHQSKCRWFLRRGDIVEYGRGFRSKRAANEWIDLLGRRLDWRAGFSFQIKGDPQVMHIVSRQGELAHIL
jgi:hypothetical protein